MTDPTAPTPQPRRWPVPTRWSYVADAVMGGVSRGELTKGIVADREATRLRGTVSLENNGGFIQMASDLTQPPPEGARGLALMLWGNRLEYDLRLRTNALSRPWQSFRTAFTAPPRWTALSFDFDDFAPHRTDQPFDAAGLRRIGILAIGSEMQADIAVGETWFYG
ncbi:MAG: CIA30 family protein [Rhodobacteraceae bacterium]|nr:CIA30 family protein [Paracoccaceae bacterium]